MRGQPLLGCYFSICITAHDKQLPVCSMCQAGYCSHRTVPRGRNTKGVWALEVIVLRLCPLWSLVLCRTERANWGDRQEAQALYHHCCSYHSSDSCHPPSKSYHQSNSPLGPQVQKAHTDGQIGDWLTLVELLLQLHPWPPNPHCISSLA